MDKIAFAKLIAYIADIQHPIQDHHITDLDKLTSGVKSYSEDCRQLIDALARDRKIEAIKMYRTITGDGLKESKDAVERVTSRFGNRLHEFEPY